LTGAKVSILKWFNVTGTLILYPGGATITFVASDPVRRLTRFTFCREIIKNAAAGLR
jgi:hypothetical protein